LQVLTNEKSELEIDMLKDIGLQIIQKCDGLPLAIKVMGGLLCQKEKERCDWEKVQSDYIWSVSRMPEELNYAIYLSYEDLSPCLKQCFLHFSLKPKKIIAGVNQIVGMWISEGFVHGNSDRLEELGREYYKELILRNLIEPDNNKPGQYVSHMHEVVRSFALFVARNEALVSHNGETDTRKLTSQKFLRLSIETKGVESDGFECRILREQKSLRTLILKGNLKIQSGDSLITFSSLRVLHIQSTNCATLVESVYQLIHLRYLAVEKCNDINSLPENIDKMQFLQYLSFFDCRNLLELPNGIVKLRELRYLGLEGIGAISVPRGLCALKDLRVIYGFPAHTSGDWCSLEELGPLSLLRDIVLEGLENVSTSLSATKAMLGAKVHLSFLGLYCTSILDDDGLVKEGVREKDLDIIEEVFDELYPPPCIEDVRIRGYFGCQLPRWIMSRATTPLNSLKILMMEDLAFCTELPDGLSQLPCLKFLKVNRAPAIKRVGPEFVQPHSHHHHLSSQMLTAFPRLHEMILDKMVEWQEWLWEEEVRAMPVLEEFYLRNCKLRCIPPGLASHAMALKKLTIQSIQHLDSLGNFASVVDLNMQGNPDLTRICNFPKLQNLHISYCPKLELLHEVTTLRRLVLTLLYSEKRLPLYLQTIKPRHLLLDCSPELLACLAAGKSGPEWDKFNHIQHVEAYAHDGCIEKRWHVFYTREPYSMETNVDLQVIYILLIRCSFPAYIVNTYS
jgi:hypothetical protein